MDLAVNKMAQDELCYLKAERTMPPLKQQGMKQLRFSRIVSTSPPRKSPTRAKNTGKAKKVEKPKVVQRRDDRNDNAIAASERETTREDRQDVTATAPPREEPPNVAVKELVARTAKDEDTGVPRSGASIVASTPYLQKLKREARRLQTMIDGLDPETDAEKIESYQDDIATLRGFIVACVAQRNMLPKDVAANALLGKSLQEDQDKIEQRFEEIQKISKRVKATRKKRRKQKPTIITDEDGDDGGEVTVKVPGIMGPPRLSANVRTPVSELPKAPTRPLSELVESQERERAAAAAAAAAAEQMVSLDDDHASAWVGPSPFCCGGGGTAEESEVQPVQTIILPTTKQIAVQEEIDDSFCENSTTDQSRRMACFQCFESHTTTKSVIISPIDEVEASSARSSEKQFQRESDVATRNTTPSVNRASDPGIQEGEPKITTPVNSEGYIPIFCCVGAPVVEDHDEALPAQDQPANLNVEIPPDVMEDTDDESFGPSPKASPSMESKAHRQIPSTNPAQIEGAASDTSDVAFDLGPGVVTVVENSVDDGIVETTASDNGLSIATGSSDELDTIDSCLCLTDDDDDDDDMLCADPDMISVSEEVIQQPPRKANFFSDVWQKWKQPREKVVKEGSTNDRRLQGNQKTMDAEVQATKAADAVNAILVKQMSSESKYTGAEDLKRQRSTDLATFLHHVSADEDSVPSHYTSASGKRVPYEIGIQRSYLRTHEMAPMTVGSVIQDLKQTSYDMGRDFQERSEGFGDAIRGMKNGEWFGLQKAYPSIFSLGSLDSLTSK